MVAELALHFAKQGCYPDDKGVVILVSQCTTLLITVRIFWVRRAVAFLI